MHSVKRILTTENRTCAIRPTAIQSLGHLFRVINTNYKNKKLDLK